MRNKKKKEIEREEIKRRKDVADQKAATRNKKIEYTEEIDKKEEEAYAEEIKQKKNDTHSNRNIFMHIKHIQDTRNKNNRKWTSNVRRNTNRQ